MSVVVWQRLCLLSAFVCICATVRCSLVTNWLGLRTDWCVGVKMMSVNVPSFMVFDVDVNVDALILHLFTYLTNLCCYFVIGITC
jgi:uncharacterized membrane protein